MLDLRHAALWSLLLFVFVLPWERNVGIPILGGIGTPVGLVAFALGIASVFANGRIRIRPPSLLLVLMSGFVAWSALGYFWSIEPGATLSRTVTYAQLLVMTWLVWQLVRDRRTLRSVLQAFVLGSLFAISVVFVSFLRGEAYFVSPITGLTRFSFGGGDPNYFALTLVLAIPMAWHLIVRGSRRWLVWVNMAYVPLAVIVVGLTGSRGGVISALIALSIIPLTYWHLPLGRKLTLIVALGGMAYGALFVVPDVTVERILDTPEALAEGALSGREQIWAAGLSFLDESDSSMLVGVGSANFRRATEAILGRERSGHNAYLNVLVENGIIGFVLFMAMFATALLPAITDRTGHGRFIFVLVLCLAVGIFGLSWEREKPLWFVLAIAAAGRAYVLTPTRPRRRSVAAGANVSDAPRTSPGPL